ncbi:hypothetical protein SKP52_07035 [Sphingopyxis fribergensis]|uniref:Secreted protein n=1 Tax=Sphingopyxis fribergensis TaxID=1515612 RepID=A0A0A7PED8_9SPHN|nr:hypothetical protein [Sphingopyxis fribergensis]AJA08329.1 hypothetical protein SKP52_07035 [Sphingopyxis fribergensis]
MLTLVLTLALSAATPEAAAQAQTTSETKPAKPKMVCRANKSTGSRLKSRICKTQEEWDGQPTNIRNDARLSGAGN